MYFRYHTVNKPFLVVTSAKRPRPPFGRPSKVFSIVLHLCRLLTLGMTTMIDNKPGAAKDYLKCYTTTCIPLNGQVSGFKQIYRILASMRTLKDMLAKHRFPGYHYFKTIFLFMDNHYIIG